MAKTFIFRKWTAVSAIVLLIVGPCSCDFFNPCDGVRSYFTITGLDITNGRGFPNSTWEKVSGQPIRWDYYTMGVYFRTTFYANVENAGAGGQLFATNCLPSGYNGSKVGVDTVYLISMNDYNGAYHENDTINPIVEINTLSQGSVFVSLADYVSGSKNGIRDAEFYVRMNQPPSEDGEYQFKLVYVLANGEVFEMMSDKVQLAQ